MVALVVVPLAFRGAVDIHMNAVFISLIVGLIGIPISEGGITFTFPFPRAFEIPVMESNPGGRISDQGLNSVVFFLGHNCREMHANVFACLAGLFLCLSFREEFELRRALSDYLADELFVVIARNVIPSVGCTEVGVSTVFAAASVVWLIVPPARVIERGAVSPLEVAFGLLISEANVEPASAIRGDDILDEVRFCVIVDGDQIATFSTAGK